MKKTFLYITALLTGLFLFQGCSSDDSDDLVGNWVKVSDFEGVSRSGAVCFTVDETVYVATGAAGTSGKKYYNDLWQYDQRKETWTQKASMDGVPRKYAVGFGANGAGFVGLGYNVDMDSNLDDFWRYDPSSNSWSEAASFGGSARHSAIAFSIQGKGYVGTGEDGNHLKDFWRYDPLADSWTQVTSIGGSKRLGASVFVIDDIAYVCCGINNSSLVTDFWAYDASTDTWTEKRKIANVSSDSYDDDYSTIARSYGAAFTMDGKGYVSCGVRSGIISNTWEYDPITDLWTERTAFEATARKEPVGFSLNGRGYILTGQSSGYYFDDMYEFFPYDEYDEYD